MRFKRKGGACKVPELLGDVTVTTGQVIEVPAAKASLLYGSRGWEPLDAWPTAAASTTDNAGAEDAPRSTSPAKRSGARKER